MTAEHQPGETPALSEREREVLFLAAEGLTDKEIAVRLRIGPKTVRTYWDRMRQKLGAASRTQALGIALRTAHSELERAEERLRLFVENMPYLFAALDEQMRIITYNQEAFRVFGYPHAEVIQAGLLYERMWPDPDYREHVLTTWRIKLGDYRDWVLPAFAADGSVRVVSWSSTARANPVPGWATWAVGVDITDRYADRTPEELFATLS